MDKRFNIKLESVNVLVIEDEKTANFGIALYKAVDDVSFLQALNTASYDLERKLADAEEPPEDESEETDELEDGEPKEDDEPLYTGTVIVTKGGDAVFTAGTVIKVTDGNAQVDDSRSTSALSKEGLNSLLRLMPPLASFKGFKSTMDAIGVEVAELKEGQV